MRSVGLVLIVLALVIGILPQFTDCASQGHDITLANGATIPMRCHWAARAELAVAGPLLVVGALVIGGRRREALAQGALLSVVLGIFAILIPTVLIGVCGNPFMSCVMLMRPSLILAGALVVATGLAGLLLSRQPQFTM